MAVWILCVPIWDVEEDVMNTVKCFSRSEESVWTLLRPPSSLRSGWLNMHWGFTLWSTFHGPTVAHEDIWDDLYNKVWSASLMSLKQIWVQLTNTAGLIAFIKWHDAKARLSTTWPVFTVCQLVVGSNQYIGLLKISDSKGPLHWYRCIFVVLVPITVFYGTF